MHDDIQLLIVGGAAGTLAALLAVGLIIKYRSSGVLDLGHGAVATVGAFLFIQSADKWHWPVGLAAVLGIVASAIVSAGFQWLVIRPSRNMPLLPRVIATLGFMLLVSSLVQWVFGEPQASLVGLVSGKPIRLGFGRPEFVIGRDRVFMVAVTVVLTIALWLIYEHTRFGRVTTAVADNQRVAELLGYSSIRTDFINWTVAGALAGVAGILLAVLVPPTSLSLTEILISALAIALITGFRSFSGMLVAGILVGAGQAILLRYAGNLQTWTHLTGWGDALPLLIIIVGVLLRGRAIAPKLRRIEKPLPRAPVARHPFRVAAGVLAVGLAWYHVAPDRLVAPTTASLVFVMAALSLMVLVGLTGQVSLAQLSFAGIGAFAAAKAATAWGVPFPLTVVFGGLVAATVAGLIGAAAIRVRGMHLAVVTLAFAIVADVMFFSNGPLTGADAGMHMPTARLFGLSLDGLTHQRALGLTVLLFAVATAIGVSTLRKSRLGLQMLAVRSNERGAGASGVSVARIKLTAFFLAGLIAGVAGSLDAYRSVQIAWSSYGFFNSIILVAFAYMGGTTYVTGACVAGLIINGGLLPTWLTFQGNAELAMNCVGGLGVVLVMLVHPQGIGHDLQRLARAVWTALHLRESRQHLRFDDLSAPHAAELRPSMRFVDTSGKRRPKPDRVAP